MELFFHFRMLRKQIPRPSHRIGGSLMTGEKNRHRFITQLEIAHSASIAFRVLREQEHGEEIAAIFALRPPDLNNAVNRGIDPAQSLFRSEERRVGKEWRLRWG